jgi:dTDP-4-amino-4,6-dideoxygalactose transaminase
VIIPFNQLWTAQESLHELVVGAAGRVLRSGKYILGAEVEAFEKEFSGYLGTFGGVGVSSGTDAITLSLMLGGVGPGDEVILPAFGPGATMAGVLATGATPVPVDVQWDFTLDQRQVAEAVTPRTKALVAVHLFGRPERVLELGKFAELHGLWLVEDCAQAHGAEVWDEKKGMWRKAGTFGDSAAFSFYPTKNLGAPGDAGFCTARTAAGADKLRSLRQYGWRRRDKAIFQGRNSRMDEIHAAVLREGLPLLEQWNVRRRRLSDLYATLLGERPELLLHSHPAGGTGSQSACHLQVVRTPKRNALRRYLSSKGVGTGVHYPLAHTQQKAFRGFGRTAGYPVAERLAREVLSLPMHPFLEESAVERVVDCLAAFWSSQ